MTDRLEKAAAQATTQIADLLKHAATLSPADQNDLAAHLEVLANDLRWEQLLDDPARAAAVDALADQALADFAAGNTRSLDDVLDVDVAAPV